MTLTDTCGIQASGAIVCWVSIALGINMHHSLMLAHLLSNVYQ
jgi:hypothetical protein